MDNLASAPGNNSRMGADPLIEPRGTNSSNSGGGSSYRDRETVKIKDARGVARVTDRCYVRDSNELRQFRVLRADERILKFS